MNGMLLAAGRGERMEPLSSFVAKPALEVLGVPLLTSSLANLRRAGCGEIVVNLHRHPDQVEAAARAAAGARIAFSREPRLLGGAGGVAAARRLLGDGAVLLGNADVWGELDLDAVVASRDDGAATLALLPHPDPERWSSVVLERDGRVRELLPPGARGAGEPFLFTGFQLLGRGVVAALPEPPCEMAVVWNDLRRSGRLRGAIVTGEWREAGTPAAYRDLVVGALGLSSWVHPDATVESGSRVERSAVGAGCGVAAGAAVERCVVTAGARVDAGATLTDCVVAGPVCVGRETIAGALLVPGRRAPLT